MAEGELRDNLPARRVTPGLRPGCTANEQLHPAVGLGLIRCLAGPPRGEVANYSSGSGVGRVDSWNEPETLSEVWA